MPRSQLRYLPWTGSVNTSLDPSVIGQDELTVGDNFIYGPTRSKLMRDGISLNFDDVTATANGTKAIVGSHEFWSGTSSRTQQFISANASKEIRKYTTSGTATLLTDAGKAWTGTVDVVNFLTFNNKALIAPAATSNLMKVWDGSSSSYSDLKNTYGHVLVASGASSSGTTRTLVMSTGFRGVNGDIVIVSGATGGNSASYNGTWTVTSVATTTVTNDTITFTGTGSLAEAGTSYATMSIDGAAPYGSILREHLGRVWTNDKSNRDRLHYSGTFNHLQWLGIGDSGALDIGVGDNDPIGIVAIFPTFRGALYVAKQTKLYKISGTSPENFSVELITDGIGCESHKSVVAIDQVDIQFVSARGVHSLDATLNGNYLAVYRPGENPSSTDKFLSSKIQKTFNDNFTKSRLKYVSGAYLPNINSSIFCFTESSLLNYSNTLTTQNNVLWLYNLDLKAWYRWPDISCETITASNDSDQVRVYFGTYRGKLTKAFNTTSADLSEAGASTNISMRIVTGQLSLNGDPYSVKGLKRVGLFNTPYGSNTVTYAISIDDRELDPVNSNAFSGNINGATLDGTFVLDSSVLQGDALMRPAVFSAEGYGRTFKLEITQIGTVNPIELQGFFIEFELANTGTEVL